MRTVKRALLFGFGLMSGILVILFVIRNREPVVIYYYAGQTQPVPVWAVAVWAFVLGAVIPVLLHMAGLVELFFDRRRLVRRVHELEQELVELRNLPLAEAEIEIERPRPPLRRMVNETKTVEAEVLPPTDSLREADLYPAIYEKREG